MRRAERFQKVLEYFETHKAPAETELHYQDPFQLLVAVVLSAQCTDRRVNLVTPRLFHDYPSAEAMARASAETLYDYIKSISYPNSKARHLSGLARQLVSDHGGEVPSDHASLVSLPGVGRKTANVITSVVFEQPSMAVDTHVFRVSNRLGLTINAKTPLQCEKQLITFIPEHLVHKAHHWLILHGRYVCIARKPKCVECPLTQYCRYFEKNFKLVKKPIIKIKKNNYPMAKKIQRKKSAKKATKKTAKKAAKKVAKKGARKASSKKAGKKASPKKATRKGGAKKAARKAGAKKAGKKAAKRPAKKASRKGAAKKTRKPARKAAGKKAAGKKTASRKSAVKRKVQKVIRKRVNRPGGLGAVAGSVSSFVRDTASSVANKFSGDNKRRDEEE